LEAFVLAIIITNPFIFNLKLFCEKQLIYVKEENQEEL